MGLYNRDSQIGVAPSSSVSPIILSIGTDGTGKASPTKYQAGMTISDTQTWNGDSFSTLFHVNAVETGTAPAWGEGSYLAFRHFDSVSEEYHYGWFEMTWNPTTKVYAFLSGGMETDAFVLPTIVPEPSSLALLALGATGLAAARRRKRAA